MNIRFKQKKYIPVYDLNQYPDLRECLHAKRMTQK